MGPRSLFRVPLLFRGLPLSGFAKKHGIFLLWLHLEGHNLWELLLLEAHGIFAVHF